MLPQPNFGRDRDPGKGAPGSDGDPDARPRKVLWLQIGLWVQVIAAVAAGNLFLLGALATRQATEAELLELYEANPNITDPVTAAREDHEFYQSADFVVLFSVLAGFTLLAAVVAAMCAIRLKSRVRAIRWWAAGASAVLFLVGMFMTTQFGYLVAPWVFAAILALWWLFSSDIRHWLDGSEPAGAGPAAKDGDGA